jgi:hypothetical protein
MCVSDIKENIPCVQVKNKPHVMESKPAFILGSTVYMVTNNNLSTDLLTVSRTGSIKAESILTFFCNCGCLSCTCRPKESYNHRFASPNR